MRSVVSLVPVIVLCTSLPALAQTNPAPASPPPARGGVHRDLALEQAVSARARKLGALLQPGAKAKLDSAAQAMLAHLAFGPKDAVPSAFAQGQVHRLFPHASREQSNLLAFYVIAEVARIVTTPDELKHSLELMNKSSKGAQLALQREWDMRKNILDAYMKAEKARSASKDALIQNLRQ